MSSGEQKYRELEDKRSILGVKWQTLDPDEDSNWITEGLDKTFKQFIALGSKESKASDRHENHVIFKMYSLGVGTNRDDWVYSFAEHSLAANVQRHIDNYNHEVARFKTAGNVKDLDSFLNRDPAFIKWTDRLKDALTKKKTITFSDRRIKDAVYRPYVRQYLYFDHLLNQRRYQQHNIFPDSQMETNYLICLPSIGGRAGYWTIVTDKIPNLTMTSIDGTQTFPFYFYEKDVRHENITDWALQQFREQYPSISPAQKASRELAIRRGFLDPKDVEPHPSGITKWAIFYYTYAVLHHPEYREKYAANLKRELPRIPFAPDFWPFANAGKTLADIHVNYEDQPEYKLDMIENGKLALDWRVEKMKYAQNRTAILYNDFLTIGGIPPGVHDYRLGNRSALDWIVDQYKISTDKRSGITNDPNRADDPQYIVRLIKKIVTVSLRTNEIVNTLPAIASG